MHVLVLKLGKEISKLDSHFPKELGPAVSVLSSTWCLFYMQQTDCLQITYTFDFNTRSGIRKKQNTFYI
jgi:hypothetical protein